MPLTLGTRLSLQDQEEGWFPLAGASLFGEVTQVLSEPTDHNPFYVVALNEPLEVQEMGASTASGISSSFYPNVVIKSRWKNCDIGSERDVSAFVLLPPVNDSCALSREKLLALPVRAWANAILCRDDA